MFGNPSAPQNPGLLLLSEFPLLDRLCEPEKQFASLAPLRFVNWAKSPIIWFVSYAKRRLAGLEAHSGLNPAGNKNRDERERHNSIEPVCYTYRWHSSVNSTNSFVFRICKSPLSSLRDFQLLPAPLHSADSADLQRLGLLSPLRERSCGAERIRTASQQQSSRILIVIFSQPTRSGLQYNEYLSHMVLCTIYYDSLSSFVSAMQITSQMTQLLAYPPVLTMQDDFELDMSFALYR